MKYRVTQQRNFSPGQLVWAYAFELSSNHMDIERQIPPMKGRFSSTCDKDGLKYSKTNTPHWFIPFKPYTNECDFTKPMAVDNLWFAMTRRDAQDCYNTLIENCQAPHRQWIETLERRKLSQSPRECRLETAAGTLVGRVNDEISCPGIAIGLEDAKDFVELVDISYYGTDKNGGPVYACWLRNMEIREHVENMVYLHVKEDA